MLFANPFFLFAVLPATLILFYAVSARGNRTAGLFVIVASSAVFYAPYGILPSGLLLVSLTTNLLIGQALIGFPDEKGAHRRFLLTAGLVLDFSLLFIFKYVLIYPSAQQIIGWDKNIEYAIPAGISFYTFHQAVFLVDAYSRRSDVIEMVGSAQGRVGSATAFIRYTTFVAFFPQLIIGPITYMREFGPQVLGIKFGKLNSINIIIGITFIITGLFKKLCLADPISDIINPVYTALEKNNVVTQKDAIFAIIGFYFQLYFDFSGYSDIALGIARLFGVTLPYNFDSPLRAVGIVDFYRRWHITLTRVIALFLFTPLSLWGTRKAVDLGLRGWKRRALASWAPFMVNFQIIALWHAASLPFVVFGLVHGAWYVLETEVRATKRFKTFATKTSPLLRFIGGVLLTAGPLMLTFALFRSPTLTAFGNLLTSLTSWGGDGKISLVNMKKLRFLIEAAAVIYLLPSTLEWTKSLKPGIITYKNQSTTPIPLRIKFSPDIKTTILLIVMMVFIFNRINEPTPFLYAGF